jgi:hypothetical protein
MILSDLHVVIQVAMGWENAHLHDFKVKGVRYSEFSEDIGDGAEGSTAVTLRGLGLRRKGQKFLYNYDFGDDWLHEITVEAVSPIEPGTECPRCLAGRRACPPEDSGGVFGYYRLLEALADPNHPEHEECADWIDPGFDPAALNVDAVNRTLRRVFDTDGARR